MAATAAGGHRTPGRDWIDAAILSVFLWSTVVILYLPLLLARHPGEGWSSAAIEGATVILAMLFGVVLFGIDRGLDRRPLALRTAGVTFGIIIVSAIQVIVDFAFTYYVARWYKPGWSTKLPDFSQFYNPFFTYLLMFGFNFALFQLVFWRRRAGDQREQLTEALLAAKQAELTALRLQMNPHFLFNSLNAISALIVTGRAADADDMVGRLSDFFRNTLTADHNALVPLATELDMIEDYLAIESVRFGDRLSVEIDVDPGSMAARVPGFILQPLVENAIKYGVSATTKPVAVRIEARRLADTVRLRVVNDMPDGATSVRPGTGLGLANVRERLRMAFGDAATCSSGLEADRRFVVALGLPVQPPEG